MNQSYRVLELGDAETQASAVITGIFHSFLIFNGIPKILYLLVNIRCNRQKQWRNGFEAVHKGSWLDYNFMRLVVNISLQISSRVNFYYYEFKICNKLTSITISIDFRSSLLSTVLNII